MMWMKHQIFQQPLYVENITNLQDASYIRYKISLKDQEIFNRNNIFLRRTPPPEMPLSDTSSAHSFQSAVIVIPPTPDHD
jgi:hypothetical protein